MRNLIILLIFILLTFAGCTSTEVDNTANLVNTTNKPLNVNATASTDNSSPLNTIRTPTPETVNPAETLSPVAGAYCEAIRKKDEAALKKVYSAATYQRLLADAKAGGKTTVAEYMSETEDVGAQPCATSNEQINGNSAIALVKTETYPNGIRIKFVKENGEWKMTDESPDVPTK